MLTKKFFNHLLGSNLILIAIIIFYNLLTYFIPLVKLSLGRIIIYFIIIDVILIGLKLLTVSQRFRP